MNPSKFKDVSIDRTRAKIITDRLRKQGETVHAELREQVIDDYLSEHIAGEGDHMDVTRWAMVAQLWALHDQGKIYRDVRKGTWVLL